MPCTINKDVPDTGRGSTILVGPLIYSTRRGIFVLRCYYYPAHARPVVPPVLCITTAKVWIRPVNAAYTRARDFRLLPKNLHHIVLGFLGIMYMGTQLCMRAYHY